MRRALLLAVLAAPALAAAQTIGSGTIQFSDGTNDLVHGPFISATECGGSASAGPYVNLSWNTALNSGVMFPADAKYTVYASNKESTAPTCNKADETATSVKAGPVGVTISGEGQTVNLKPYATSEFVRVSGIACTTTADTPIYVCVQAYLNDGTTAIGYAKGTLTLSTAKPAAPSNVQAVPSDDGALLVSWAAPSGDPQAYDYRLRAVGAGDTSNHETIVTQKTETTVSGLTNDVPYTLSVWARSKAGNESTNPATGTGTPVMVQNFWEVYQATPGAIEQGGCASGAAGPLALLGLAALLAKLRRRA